MARQPKFWIWERELVRENNTAPRLLNVPFCAGKFTQALVDALKSDERMRKVVEIGAREPVAGMRDKFRDKFPNMRLLEGSADKIPPPDASLQAVVCAQAFHW